MNIMDILRGLPFPMQGALMSVMGNTQEAPAAPQAGGGRGFVNPPLVNPNAARPQMPQVRSPGPVQVPKDEAGFEEVIKRIMAGGSTDELQNAPAAAVTPVQEAMQPPAGNPTDIGPKQGTQAVPELAGYERQGILSRMGFQDGNQAMMALGGALAAAGSPDPAKTALSIQQQRLEEGKVAEARRLANLPKFTALQGGAFTRVEVPGMLPVDLPNDQVQKFIRDTADSKSVADLQRQLAVAQAGLDNKRKFELFDNTVKEAGGATTKAEFSPAVTAQLTEIDGLLKRIPGVDTLPGGINNPMLANAIDQTIGRGLSTEAYAVRRDVDRVFKEATLSTIKQLGANPTEGERKYAERMQAAQDDPTGRKIELLKEHQEFLKSREEARVRAAQQRDTMASGGSAPTAAPATSAPASPRLNVPGLSQRTLELYNR